MGVFTGLKNILVKGGLGIAAIAIIGGGGYLFFQWAEHKSDAQLAAVQSHAYDQGKAEAQRDTATAANAQMTAAILRIESLTADTNTKMANIRVAGKQEQTVIDNYHAADVAIDHPDQVEKWANDTTSDLFAGIADATKQESKQ